VGVSSGSDTVDHDPVTRHDVTVPRQLISMCDTTILRLPVPVGWTVGDKRQQDCRRRDRNSRCRQTNAPARTTLGARFLVYQTNVRDGQPCKVEAFALDAEYRSW
jgi:hypothetical protein